jgi:hypothetical protein
MGKPLDGYYFEHIHVYVCQAWHGRAFGLEMSVAADELQNELICDRLQELES